MPFMNLRHTLLFLSLLLLVPVPLAGEPPLALHRQMEQAAGPAERIEALLELGDHFEPFLFDSAHHYYSQAHELAIGLESDASGQVSESRVQELKLSSLRKLGFMYKEWGHYEQAAAHYLQALEYALGLGDTLTAGQLLLSLGNSEHYQGKYPEAAGYYFRALEKTRRIQDSVYMARALQNLGVIHQLMGHHGPAVEYSLEALQLYQKQENEAGRAGVLLVLGNIDLENKDFAKALEHYQESYQAFGRAGHQVGEYTALMNIGLVYLEEGHYETAIARFRESLEMARQLNQPINVSRNLHNIALAYSRGGDPRRALDYYEQAREVAAAANNRTGVLGAMVNMSSIYNDLGDHRRAISLARQSLELARETGTLDDQREAYRNLATAHEGLGQHRQALEYHKLFKHFSDSILNIESRRDINRLEALYQYESMQQQMDLQQALLENQQEEFRQQSLLLKQQRMLRNVFIFAFAAVALTLALIYWNLVQRKRANNRMQRQKQRIEKINEQLTQQNHSIKAHRDEIRNQNQQIEEKNLTLMASIRYARQLQEALLPKPGEMQELLGEHFLIFRPREPVSGDFYWVGHQNDVTLVAMADATGHGVPGAFLSILGLTFLNEYIHTRLFTSAGNVLNEMRSYVNQSLQQEGRNESQAEGFDMAFLALDHNNYTLQYAGARNPLIVAGAPPVYLNQAAPGTKTAGLHKVPADLMPVAYHMKMQPFTTWEMKLQPGNMIYLFTDGFADQLGGGQRMRFSSQRMLDLLEEIHSLPVESQQQALEAAFNEWKGDAQQVDDVSVLGIRL
jgi:serine phosphatase RsbU (regulator of sigma subunit)/tetratricopeptide (TPR) repeat protein